MRRVLGLPVTQPFPSPSPRLPGPPTDPREPFTCPTFCPPDAAIVLRLLQLLAALPLLVARLWPLPLKACHGGALGRGLQGPAGHAASRSLRTLSNACGRFADALGPLSWVTAASEAPPIPLSQSAMGGEGGPALSDFSG